MECYMPVSNQQDPKRKCLFVAPYDINRLCEQGRMSVKIWCLFSSSHIWTWSS